MAANDIYEGMAGMPRLRPSGEFMPQRPFADFPGTLKLVGEYEGADTGRHMDLLR